MDIDLLKVVDKNDLQASQNKLNAVVAAMVACLATFVGIFHVNGFSWSF